MQTPVLLAFLCECGCGLCVDVGGCVEGIGHLYVVVELAEGGVDVGHVDGGGCVEVVCCILLDQMKVKSKEESQTNRSPNRSLGQPTVHEPRFPLAVAMSSMSSM